MSSYLQACKNCRFGKATRTTLTDIGDCGLPLVLGLLALHPDEGSIVAGRDLDSKGVIRKRCKDCVVEESVGRSRD
jgi:hypothetical protein